MTVTYRFGREEDEVMGLSFSKEMQLICQQVHPSLVSAAPNDVQQRLMNKIGGDAHPFNLHLPEEAPVSVQLSSGSQHTVGRGLRLGFVFLSVYISWTCILSTYLYFLNMTHALYLFIFL